MTLPMPIIIGYPIEKLVMGFSPIFLVFFLPVVLARSTTPWPKPAYCELEPVVKHFDNLVLLGQSHKMYHRLQEIFDALNSISNQEKRKRAAYTVQQFLDEIRNKGIELFGEEYRETVNDWIFGLKKRIQYSAYYLFDISQKIESDPKYNEAGFTKENGKFYERYAKEVLSRTKPNSLAWKLTSLYGEFYKFFNYDTIPMDRIVIASNQILGQCSNDWPSLRWPEFEELPKVP